MAFRKHTSNPPAKTRHAARKNLLSMCQSVLRPCLCPGWSSRSAHRVQHKEHLITEERIVSGAGMPPWLENQKVNKRAVEPGEKVIFPAWSLLKKKKSPCLFKQWRKTYLTIIFQRRATNDHAWPGGTSNCLTSSFKEVWNYINQL